MVGFRCERRQGVVAVNWVSVELNEFFGRRFGVVTVAQLVESQIVILVVVGSSPIGHPIFPTLIPLTVLPSSDRPPVECQRPLLSQQRWWPVGYWSLAKLSATSSGQPFLQSRTKGIKVLSPCCLRSNFRKEKYPQVFPLG